MTLLGSVKLVRRLLLIPHSLSSRSFPEILGQVLLVQGPIEPQKTLTLPGLQLPEIPKDYPLLAAVDAVTVIYELQVSVKLATGTFSGSSLEFVMPILVGAHSMIPKGAEETI